MFTRWIENQAFFTQSGASKRLVGKLVNTVTRVIIGTPGEPKKDGKSGDDEDELTGSEEKQGYYGQLASSKDFASKWAIHLDHVSKTHKKKPQDLALVAKLKQFKNIESIRETFCPDFLVPAFSSKKGYLNYLFPNDFMPCLKLFDLVNQKTAGRSYQNLMPRANVQARFQTLSNTNLAHIWCAYLKSCTENERVQIKDRVVELQEQYPDHQAGKPYLHFALMNTTQAIS